MLYQFPSQEVANRNVGSLRSRILVLSNGVLTRNARRVPTFLSIKIQNQINILYEPVNLINCRTRSTLEDTRSFHHNICHMKESHTKNGSRYLKQLGNEITNLKRSKWTANISTYDNNAIYIYIYIYYIYIYIYIYNIYIYIYIYIYI